MRSICGISLRFYMERRRARRHPAALTEAQTEGSLSFISIHIDVINSAALLYGFIKWWNEFMWVSSNASRRHRVEMTIKCEEEAVKMHCWCFRKKNIPCIIFRFHHKRFFGSLAASQSSNVNEVKLYPQALRFTMPLLSNSFRVVSVHLPAKFWRKYNWELSETILKVYSN